MVLERSDAVYGDPVLDRMLSLTKLPLAEQLNWIEWTSSKLLARRAELVRELSQANEGHVDLAYDAECALIDVRLESLKRLRDYILAKQRASSDKLRPAGEKDD